jgi:type VI secretion system secreted protein Hcp
MPSSAMPAGQVGDCLILFDQVPGESSDGDFPGAIGVTEWKWGVGWRGDLSSGGRPNGVAEVRHFGFTHRLDTASCGLIHRCVFAGLVPKATLVMRRSGGTAQKFLEMKFKNVRIVDVTQTFDGQSLPLEQVLFSFDHVDIDYVPQSKLGGDRSGRHSFAWQAPGAK